MKIEIDQSGKIENTSKHTVLADSLGHYVVIQPREKRLVQQLYRVTGRPQIFVYDTFAVLTAILIKQSYTNHNTYVIDREYFGHEALLKGLIKKYLFRRDIPASNHQLSFGLIGKKTAAHENAYMHYKCRLQNEVFITYEDMLKVLMT